MSWFDQTADQRLKSSLPRYLARPTQGEMSPFEHDRSWVAVVDWSASDYLKKGWQVVPIDCHRPMPTGAHRHLQEDHDQQRREYKDQVSRWADGFISGNGMAELVWPEDERAMLEEVARRLQEATADGFLLRALEADHAAG